MKREIHILQKEQGQSMVELALTITFLMLLLAGTMDLGRAFFTWLTMRDAAQEGASYGSIEPTDTTGILDRISSNLDQIIPSGEYSVIIDAEPHCLGDMIQVDINYPKFDITTPLLGAIIGDQIPIHATINDTILANCD